MEMLLHWCLLSIGFSLSTSTTETEAILWVKTGEKFTMKCSTTLKDQDGMYLYVGLDRDREVLYYHQHDSKLTTRIGYWNRVKTEGPVDQLTITVSNLTIEDTGVYCSTDPYIDTRFAQLEAETEMAAEIETKDLSARLVLIIISPLYKPGPDIHSLPDR
ncbi:uncharacterized protein LOC118364832 isoform X4 [Oncorhynchus keta]|uniref:uncharacterized protein LOC118364832 isoform X4 n=1 Tax=Oncorhynchus keta TaxID=8018 RepID=UPI00227AB7AF|nr:uncharacterized protein LOC118364832 isoform X4 [Oncorhynchus keta]